MNRSHLFLISAMFLAALSSPLAQARAQTEQNMSELANVPAWWTNARLCYQEGGAGESGPRVVLGVDGADDTRPKVFALRPEKPEAELPDYLRTSAVTSSSKQVSIPQAPSVGFTDGFYEVFVMPNGVRLTCEALPDR